GGQLTEVVRRKPHCVILLDEIEKAHPDVFNILLQIFDDGHLTDAKGRKVDFRNAVVIMTSNLGSDLIRKDTSLGFAVKQNEAKDIQQAYERMKDKVLGEMKRFFRPEFLNRIDAVVVFHSLTKDHIISIVDLMLNQVRGQMKEKDIDLAVTKAAREFLAEKGYDPEMGARPLRRVIQNMVEDRLSEELLAGHFRPGDTVLVDLADEELVFRSKVAAPV
ncbi:MAG: ATP-dependent Clp protease ATP-binding subunit, partial [Chloroflexi bacterium]|nr:ATP-dependent Clp protease ATP-binding subunit [Chloroflexota bacterium]